MKFCQEKDRVLKPRKELSNLLKVFDLSLLAIANTVFTLGYISNLDTIIMLINNGLME